MDAFAQVAGTPLGGSTGPIDMSVYGLFMQADWVVKAVMIALLLASFWSWAIIFEKMLRQPDRPAASAHAGDDELGADQGLPAAASLLDHVERGAAQFAATGDNLDGLVEPGGLQVIDGAAADDPVDTALVAQGAVLLAKQPQQFGAAALEEAQPVGVVDDAGRVGVLVINPKRQHMDAIGEMTGRWPARYRGAHASSDGSPVASRSSWRF